MTIGRLNGLALMNAHRDRLNNIQTDCIIEHFLKSGKRRLDFKVIVPIDNEDVDVGDQGSFYLLLIFINTMKLIEEALRFKGIVKCFFFKQNFRRISKIESILRSNMFLFFSNST